MGMLIYLFMTIKQTMYECSVCNRQCDLINDNIIYTNMCENNDIYKNIYKYYCEICYNELKGISEQVLIYYKIIDLISGRFNDDITNKIEDYLYPQNTCFCGNKYAGDCVDKLCSSCCENKKCSRHYTKKNTSMYETDKYKEMFSQNAMYNVCNILHDIPKDILNIIDRYSNPIKKCTKCKIYNKTIYECIECDMINCINCNSGPRYINTISTKCYSCIYDKCDIDKHLSYCVQCAVKHEISLGDVKFILRCTECDRDITNKKYFSCIKCKKYWCSDCCEGIICCSSCDVQLCEDCCDDYLYTCCEGYCGEHYCTPCRDFLNKCVTCDAPVCTGYKCGSCASIICKKCFESDACIECGGQCSNCITKCDSCESDRCSKCSNDEENTCAQCSVNICSECRINCDCCDKILCLDCNTSNNMKKCYKCKAKTCAECSFTYTGHKRKNIVICKDCDEDITV